MDAPEDAKDEVKDEDVRDAEDEPVNGLDKEKDDDRSPSPRARSESRERDVSRSPDSRSPVCFLPLLPCFHRNHYF